MTKNTKTEDKLLGIDTAITRRDFLGSTLVGAGSALLAAHSPGLLAGGGAPPTPQLGKNWTGPGGIGDYSSSNGNTADVVNAAHAMRDGRFAEKISRAMDTGETYDLVVVGGGFSGLSAAYTYHKHSGDNKTCLILDNHAIFGGEAKQNEFDVDGHRLYGPQGSNGNLWPVSVTKQMGYYHDYWQELGLPDEFTWQELSGTNKDLRVAKAAGFGVQQSVC